MSNLVMDDLSWYKMSIVKFQMSTCDVGVVVSDSILTNFRIEHFLNTAITDLFHSMSLSPGLNLNNPKWNAISHGKSSCMVFKCVLYATTYFISPYLVQSTR